jgi:NAD(P)-dependent dehydrogenase (short-subunit alcohol dehydrogenase family)
VVAYSSTCSECLGDLTTVRQRPGHTVSRLSEGYSDKSRVTEGSGATYSLEDFDRMVAINVRAAFIGIQAAAQEMKNGGRIVLIASNVGT